ncbi:MAG: WG repeat-containing protein [Prevotella sp.]|nr:WG repeat-containing protein [Prevotella sp.]
MNQFINIIKLKTYETESIHKDGKEGAEGKNGGTLIPLSRGYDFICFHPKINVMGYFSVSRNDKEGACDITGKEIIAPNKYDFVSFHEEDGHVGYYEVQINGVEGACDITGKEIVPCRYQSIIYSIDCFKYKNSAGEWIEMDIKLDKQGRAYGSEVASSSSSSSTSSTSSNSSSSSSSSSNSNTGNNTTTIHVEHHHDPVPFQQWQACWACGGMGTMGCDFCGGSGTKYIGDRLHRCSRCNGRGIIPCNICYGNKGQYVTVYK